MLVAAGANLTIQDNEGKTPKLLALQADDQSLAAYLESKWILGDDVSGVNNGDAIWLTKCNGSQLGSSEFMT